jgi:DNA-directed RNA polymerase specialized sigma subunit
MEHEALIAKLAHQLYKKTHLYDFEDLFQIGLQSAFRLDKSYNANIAKKTTFYTICIKRDMIKFIVKHKKNFSDVSSQLVGWTKTPLQANSSDPIWEILPELNERDGKIVDMLSSGYTKKEVSMHFDMTSHQLHRILDRIGRLINE